MSQEARLEARILSAARQLILTRGYSRMTMDGLAAELRVSKKTLYQHFSSKESLGQSVLEATLEEISTALRAIVKDRELDFDARLSRMVQVLSLRYREAGRALDDLQRDAPELWERLLELRRAAVQDNFERLLASGLREGVIRKDVEPRLMVRMVLTLVDQLLRPDALAALELGADEVFTQLLAVVGDGLRAGRKEPAARGGKSTARVRAKQVAVSRRST